MFLSYNMLSEGILNNTLPSRQEYLYLEANDSNSSLKIDALHVQNYEIDDATILAVNSEESWNAYSIILGNFENTLESGSLVVSIPYPLTSYVIRRKEVGDTLNPILTTLDYDRDLVTYTDYTPRNNVKYIYTLSPYYSDGTESGYVEGRGLNNGEVGDSVSFWGYTLSEVASTPVTQYFFDMEMESGEIAINKDYKIYTSFNKYPAFRFSSLEYRSGSLSIMPYLLNGTVIETTEVNLQAICAFLNNGDEKLLRTPSGDSIQVITYEARYKYMDKITTINDNQPAKITFSWCEIDEVT